MSSSAPSVESWVRVAVFCRNRLRTLTQVLLRLPCPSFLPSLSCSANCVKTWDRILNELQFKDRWPATLTQFSIQFAQTDDEVKEDGLRLTEYPETKPDSESWEGFGKKTATLPQVSAQVTNHFIFVAIVLSNDHVQHSKSPNQINNKKIAFEQLSTLHQIAPSTIEIEIFFSFFLIRLGHKESSFKLYGPVGHSLLEHTCLPSTLFFIIIFLQYQLEIHSTSDTTCNCTTLTES